MKKESKKIQIVRNILENWQYGMTGHELKIVRLVLRIHSETLACAIEGHTLERPLDGEKIERIENECRGQEVGAYIDEEARVRIRCYVRGAFLRRKPFIERIDELTSCVGNIKKIVDEVDIFKNHFF